MKTHHRHHH